jgi:hypothetical protein
VTDDLIKRRIKIRAPLSYYRTLGPDTPKWKSLSWSWPSCCEQWPWSLWHPTKMTRCPGSRPLPVPYAMTITAATFQRWREIVLAVHQVAYPDRSFHSCKSIIAGLNSRAV